MPTRVNFLLLLAALSAPAAYSSTAIVSFTNDTVAGHGNFDLAGFQFSTSTSIDVTSLGMYVSGASLADTHDIGVYDLAGDLEFFGTVDSGATPDGSGFTYVNVGDNFLTAGNYFIGVLYNQGSPDEMYSGSGSITMAPGLAFLNAQVYFSGGPVNFFDPASTSKFTQGLPRDSYIGPNFMFNVVPEPGTLGMFVIGAAALALRRRK